VVTPIVFMSLDADRENTSQPQWVDYLRRWVHFAAVTACNSALPIQLVRFEAEFCAGAETDLNNSQSGVFS
jgi:hypothetical protein